MLNRVSDLTYRFDTISRLVLVCFAMKEHKCDSCGWPVDPERDKCARDKNGDWLCHDCHVQAVLVLKAFHGVEWEGKTFGYELSKAQGSFGNPPFPSSS
jgi:hypothetical protein